jgi:CRISPR/Cas system-associated protein endoribonuclease Cas2
MKKEDEEKLNQLLEAIDALTEAIMGDKEETFPEDAITAFRITDKVYDEMEKELGEGWMNHMGIT